LNKPSTTQRAPTPAPGVLQAIDQRSQ
jgi:hypothetical protein